MEKILSKLGLTSVPTMSELAQIMPKVATLSESERTLLFNAISKTANVRKTPKAKTTYTKTVKPAIVGAGFPRYFIGDVGISGEEESFTYKTNEEGEKVEIKHHWQLIVTIYPAVKGSKVINPAKAEVVYKDPKPYADGKFLREVAKDTSVVLRPDFDKLAETYAMTCTDYETNSVHTLWDNLKVYDSQFNEVKLATLLQSFSPYLERPCQFYLKIDKANKSFTFLTKIPANNLTPMVVEKIKG